ncbi:hypothetical protein GCM10028808_14310 [Spirosoma migulaei]
MTLDAFSQQKENNVYSFSATTSSSVTTSALEFIGKQFYDRAKTLDTCCLFAVGSARFTVHHKKIDNILISIGIPEHIGLTVQEAIQASSPFWKLRQPSQEITIILPIYIFPSPICNTKNYKDSIITSSANMMVYQDQYKIKGVKRYNYLSMARGIEMGYLLPPLLIKGTIIDIYPARPNK